MGEYVEIPLSGKRGKGLVALVDAVDAPLVQGKKWYAQKWRDGTVYAFLHGNASTRSMHRIILGLERGDLREGDHINGDGLDNRRNNLRIATHSQQMQNKRRRSQIVKAPYKGVRRRGNRFHAIIRPSGFVYLGAFATAEEAAMRYNVAARKYFGEFACFNQVNMG